jgi:hypothetical protein
LLADVLAARTYKTGDPPPIPLWGLDTEELDYLERLALDGLAREDDKVCLNDALGGEHGPGVVRVMACAYCDKCWSVMSDDDEPTNEGQP